MNKVEKSILELLQKGKPLKAREIAETLNIDKKEVNHYLYLKTSDISNLCTHDKDYRWSLKETADSKIQRKNDEVLQMNFGLTESITDNESNKTESLHNEETKEPVTIEAIESDDNFVNIKQDDVVELSDNSNAIDKVFEAITTTANHSTLSREELPSEDSLTRLCNYYLDCIISEQNEGVDAYIEDKFDLKYVDLDSFPSGNTDMSEDAMNIIQKNMTSQNTELYFGYPILIIKDQYPKIAPVFLYEIEKTSGNINFLETPQINIKVIKHYVTRSNEGIALELNRLEQQLGLKEDKVIRTDELTLQLTNIRQWQWKDQYSLEMFNKESLKDIKETGIYNKAVIIGKTSSPYTEGLVSELGKLSSAKLGNCKGTALYDWVTQNSDNDNNEPDVKKILEVLPMNREQKLAVTNALKERISVITGPPGTGKSQVVTNLLINAANNNESVLFSSKNNNAVDVVFKRVDGLTKTPFLARLGAKNYTGTRDLLTKMLDAANNPITEEEFDSLENNLKKIEAEISLYENSIKKHISIRNEVDFLEQDIEQFRKDYSKYILQKEEAIDTKEIKSIWAMLKSAVASLDYASQSIFTKLLWKKNKLLREQHLLQVNEETDTLFLILKIDKPKTVNEIITSVKSITEEVLSNEIEIIERINRYINSKSELMELTPLEEVQHNLIDAKEKYQQVVSAYWEGKLLYNVKQLTQKDISNIQEYIVASRLLQGKEENSEISQEIKNMYKKVQSLIPKYIQCQAVTLLSAKGKIPFSPGCFDLLIVDEASQCDIASVIPLLYRCKRAVIIGDSKQLTHVTSLTPVKDAEIMNRHNINSFLWSYSKASVYDLASSLSRKTIMLREHHRSHADIIDFSSKEFYGDSIVTATKYSQLKLPNKKEAGVRWIDVKGKTLRPFNGSAQNEIEAMAVVEELRRLSMSVGYEGTIGVVSPFKKQAECIRKAVEKDKELYQQLTENNAFLADTVHKFQGDERDVMIFSPTISLGAKDTAVSFLGSTSNLFNVAMTRAKSLLTVVGDKEYCSKAGIQYMQNFISYVDEKQRVLDGSQYNVKPTAKYPTVNNPEQVSDWEILFYEKLYEAGIVTLPQYPVDKYKLDLALINGEKKLDIEVDGVQYHANWDGELCYRDQLRNQRMFELGWDVMRFWVYEIRDDMDWCIERISQWMQ